jgi:PLP dependent protein
MQFIAQQLNTIRAYVNELEQKYGREKNSVKIVAASKTRTAEEILGAFEHGQLDFGENYQQEAVAKIKPLSCKNIVWHFIGPLQTNKARHIAEHFSWIHSIDRVKIAKRLSQLRSPDQTKLNVCIQVNVSQEKSKSGTSLDELKSLADTIVQLPGLKLRGLMALPAPDTALSKQREAFREVRAYLELLCSYGHELDTLSIGTSNDMEAAIAEGATIIRLGTALFGARK